MTVSTTVDADAVSTLPAWHSIDWAKCNEEVRKLQVRIAKATREGNRRKVKALQWLLTHSFSAKALAVQRVTENQGKKTPGVDGETWSTPEAKAEGIVSLKRRGYQPKPLRRVYIPKANGKTRPLGIPTMKDRAMQTLHLLALLPYAETKADWHSYGFRPERSTRDAIGHLYNVLSKKRSAQWVLEGDIKGCFDHISHEWMLTNICTDTVVLAKWLKAGFIDKGELFPTEEGTPQGGPISPTLANLVLDGLEELLGRKFGSRRLDGHNGRVSRYLVHVCRYADDFVITGNSKELLEDEVKPLVRGFLAQRGLTLSEDKTKVTRVAEGFDFLGQHVRKYRHGKPNSRLLITPAKGNVQAFLRKVRKIRRLMRTARQQDVIATLNPLLVGWANYHRHVAAKATFSRLDHLIWRALWRWAKRRHPGKRVRWILQRYFAQVGERSLVFCCPDQEEKDKLHVLAELSGVAIVRHQKIRGAAQPFDPMFEEYFEQRLAVQMERCLKGRRRLLFLWKRQTGLCPVCGDAITKITRWHVHHLVQRVHGGSDASSNLYLLHPTCHRQHHSNPRLKWRLPAEAQPSA
jgi:RNA-directed DNA polymerase